MILTDNETKVDLLNNEAIAKTIIALLREKPERPVTIGVHGDWGAGKSSILEMIESGLADQDGVLCLKFNGWRFQGFEDAKIALIEGIVTGLLEKRPLLSKAGAAVTDIFRRIDWLKIARHGGGLAFTAMTGIPTADQIGAVVDTLKGVFADPAKLATKENYDKAVDGVQGLLKPAESKNVPEEIEAFRKAFTGLLKAAGIDQLIVLIDDLDRCLPDTAIETLEAVRLFVFTDRTAFVVAADEAMIEYSVRKHFPELPDTTGPRDYARNYLEKLIQIPFRIPALGETETRIYVTLLLIGAELADDDADYAKLDRGRARPAQAAVGDRGPGCEHGQDRVGRQGRQGPERAHAQRSDRAHPRQRHPGQSATDQAILEHAPIAAPDRVGARIRRGGQAPRPGEAHVGRALLVPVVRPDRERRRPQSRWKMRRPLGPRDDRRRCGGDVKAQTEWCEGDLDDEEAKSDAAIKDSAVLAEWKAAEAIRAWARLTPPLAEIDLRPYLFVTKDRKDYFGAASVLGRLAAVVEKLLGSKLAVQAFEGELKQLVPAEAAQVFEELRGRVMGSDAFETSPPGVDGIAVLVRAHPTLQSSLLDLLEALPADRCGPWPASGWEGVIKETESVARFERLLQTWSTSKGAFLKTTAAAALRTRRDRR